MITVNAILVIDVDTVFNRTCAEHGKTMWMRILVDDEVQPEEKFSILYHDLKRIAGIDKTFVYPGYSFNTGSGLALQVLYAEKILMESLTGQNHHQVNFRYYIPRRAGHLNLLMHQGWNNREN